MGYIIELIDTISIDRAMKSYLYKWCAAIGLLLTTYVGNAQKPIYTPDILGAQYECTTLTLPCDYSGEVVATLVRHRPTCKTRRAVLYIHGYNDYFFQSEMGDSIAQAGYNFYALDLRKYGRSIRPGQRLFECKDVREYQEEIGRAMQIIKEEGNQDVYLMAHSTGGLIASLYLHDTMNRDGIKGLILNSPFIDYNSTKFNERVLLPLVTSMAWLAPNMVIIPASKPGEDDHYSRSLLAGHYGRWTFNIEWKKPQGYPIRASWLRAIKRGHKRLQAGLNIDIPVLLMSSTKSIIPKGAAWRQEYAQADLVLDVTDMWRYGDSIAKEVQYAKIPSGLHDLFLSSDDEARRRTYEVLFFWLNAQQHKEPSTTVVETHEERPDLVGQKANIKMPILYGGKEQ